MFPYDSSLEILPSNVLVVDRREDLLEIRDDKYNAVLWRRGPDPLIRAYAFGLPIIQVSEDSSAAFQREMMSINSRFGRSFSPWWFAKRAKRRFYKGRASFLEEHRKLHAIMDQLQNGNRSILSVMNREVTGFNFHQDEGFTLNWTLLGPPALWLEEEDTEAIDDRYYEAPTYEELVRQFPDDIVAVYEGLNSGDLVLPPEFFPFVHSRPDRAEGVRRALHQIYL